MSLASRDLLGITIAATLLMSGCASQPQLVVPAPLIVPAKDDGANAATHAQREPAAVTQTLITTATPRSGAVGPTTAGGSINEALPSLGSQPVNVNVQNVPVPVFANEVFGQLLDLNVSMSPEVSGLQELVTLRTESRQRPRDLFLLTRQLLNEYGVAVTVEGSLVKLTKAVSGESLTPPLLISGKAAPQVPVSHRPVFHAIELDVIRSGDAARWLGNLFGREVNVLDEAGRNTIIISGKPAQVKLAVEALRVFDRPLMRGRVSSRLEPAFMSADQLADRLVDVMSAQGYSANKSVGSPSSIIVLPIAAVNSVLIFTTSDETLDYVISWAKELDKPSKQAGSESMFYYQVRNTKASDLINALQGGSSGPGQAEPASTENARAKPASGSTTGSGTLMVDEPRNAVIYRGEPSQWERTLALIKQMDRSPRQAMIEVTIAEVTLDDANEFGVSWFAKNGFDRFNGNVWSGSGSGGTGAGSGGNGLTYLLDVAGQNRLALTAFADDNRVSILSTPRLLVKSGSKATFDVGTEVPTVTMSTTSAQQTGGTSNLLQSVQYRKTGIILQIEPTIYSDNRIDLDITQEVSEAMPLSSNATANSPSIFNRAVTTSLSLRDGGSVVLGGLMSTRDSNSDSGIPLVKDIPILGNLFKSKSVKKNKTELVLMIVPYIIESDEQSEAVSRAVVDKLELLNLEQHFPKEPANSPAGPTRASNLPPSSH